MSLNVKFGVSTWLWTSPFSTETIDLLPKIKDMGYDLVEIPVEDPGIIDTRKVKKALDDLNLGCTVCGAFGPGRDLTNDDPAIVKQGLEYIDGCLEIATDLGASFFAGPMYSAVGKARLVSAEQKKIEWGRAVENLSKVCESATAKGLDLAIEPLNRFETDLIHRAEDVMSLISDINHPNAKVLLDGFHMNIEEPSITEAIRTAGDKLIHVQVSENYRGTPGTGQTRWEDYMIGLKAINYQGAVTIESFTPNNQQLAEAVCIWKPLVPSQDGFASEGIQFLKKWAQKG
ncbi:MAG: sugar phosphate isomerase/epimerase family protein [Marinoscillum sp.]